MAKTPARSCSGPRTTPTLPACRSPAGAIPTPSLIIRWCRRPPVRHADRNCFSTIIEDPAPPQEDENFAAEAQAQHHDGRPSVRGAEGARQYGHRRGRQGDGRPVRDDPRQRRLPLALQAQRSPVRGRSAAALLRSWSIPPAPSRRPSSSSGAAVQALSAPLAACPKQAHGSWV